MSYQFSIIPMSAIAFNDGIRVVRAPGACFVNGKFWVFFRDEFFYFINVFPGIFDFIAPREQSLVAFNKIEKQALVSLGEFPVESRMITKLHGYRVELDPKAGKFRGDVQKQT